MPITMPVAFSQVLVYVYIEQHAKVTHKRPQTIPSKISILIPSSLSTKTHLVVAPPGTLPLHPWPRCITPLTALPHDAKLSTTHASLSVRHHRASFSLYCNFSGLGDWKAVGLFRHWGRGAAFRQQQGSRNRRSRRRGGGVKWRSASTQSAARPEDEHVRPVVAAVLSTLLRCRHEPGQGALAPGGGADAPR